MTIMLGSKAWCWTVAESLHPVFLLVSWRQGLRRLDLDWAFETANPTTVIHLLQHHLILPKWFHQLESKHSNI